MKARYWILMLILILVAVAFGILLFCSSVGQHPRIENAIQSAGIFVALLAAVIALSAADPLRRKVTAAIDKPLLTDEEKHYHNKMLEDLKELCKALPDPVRSHRVHFAVTNTCAFTWAKPVLSFRIPIDRKHPAGKDKENLSGLTFNSNLYNSQKELRILEVADACIISNSNVPYWNPGEKITFWIRMVVDNGKREPFNVYVSVNCDNADGITETVTLDPHNLLKGIKPKETGA
jgi:hypothetical protein